MCNHEIKIIRLKQGTSSLLQNYKIMHQCLLINIYKLNKVEHQSTISMLTLNTFSVGLYLTDSNSNSKFSSFNYYALSHLKHRTLC